MRLRFAAFVTSCALIGSVPALAAPAFGVVTFTINGSFKTPVTPAGGVKCKGYVALAPDTSTSPSIAALGAALLFRSGIVNSEANATITNAGQKFTCTVVVPYRWHDVTVGQQMIIFYDAAGWDTGTKPSKSHQVISIIPVPPDGTNTPVLAKPYL